MPTPSVAMTTLANMS